MSQSDDDFVIEQITDVKKSKNNKNWQVKCKLQNKNVQEWIYLTNVNYRSALENLEDLNHRVRNNKKKQKLVVQALFWANKNKDSFEDQQVIDDFTDSYKEFLQQFESDSSSDDSIDQEICYNGEFAYGDIDLTKNNQYIIYKYNLEKGKEIIDIEESDLLQEIKTIKNKKFLIEFGQKIEQIYTQNCELISNLKSTLKQFLLVL